MEKLADSTQVRRGRRQVCQAVEASQGGGGLGIDIPRSAADTFQLTELGFQSLLLRLQLLENQRHGAELIRPLRQGKVFTGPLPLSSHGRQCGLLLGQGRVEPGVLLLALGDGAQLRFQSGTQGRGQQTLTDAAQQEARRQQAIDVVVLALGAVALLVQAAQVAEGALIGLPVHRPSATQVEDPSVQRIARRLLRTRLTSLDAGPLVQFFQQPPMSLRFNQRRELRRRLYAHGFGVGDHLGLTVAAKVALF